MKTFNLIICTILLMTYVHQDVSFADNSKTIIDFVPDADASYAWYKRDHKGFYLATYLWDNRNPERRIVLELRIPLSETQEIEPHTHLIDKEGAKSILYTGGGDLISYVGNPVPLRLPPFRFVPNPSGEGLIEIKIPLPYESEEAKSGKFTAINIPSATTMETDVIAEIKELSIEFSANRTIVITRTQFKIIVMPA